jgi:hypothetical protein
MCSKLGFCRVPELELPETGRKLLKLLIISDGLSRRSRGFPFWLKLLI